MEKPAQANTEPRHTIGVVARRTGLSTHAIRVWERRYGLIEPVRTPTNRRLYSDADVRLLRTLKHATDAGHSIGSISHLPLDDLQQLVVESGGAAAIASPAAHSDKGSEPYLAQAQKAARAMDADHLRKVLLQASLNLGRMRAVESVIAPLLDWVGEKWKDGSMRVGQEHLVSAAIRNFFAEDGAGHNSPSTAPLLVVATPQGQLHEFGALMAAEVAASEGWRIVYLGPNLPPEEIAHIAQERRARAVAISVVYPHDDPYLTRHLKQLADHLPEGVAIFVGGRAARHHQVFLADMGARYTTSLQDFRRQLEDARTIETP